ncbi:MAG: MBL fold metallo-hydrolase [Syntrophobacteraceae bacterium]
MRVVFLGVGEACDETLPNTSIWLQARTEYGSRSVLLDCGFTVPPRYFAQTTDPEDLDALWISHFHGDHFFGVPALILRLWETRRRKPLTIVGQEGVEEKVTQAMELAYPGFLAKLMYPLEFIPVEAGRAIDVAGLLWRFASNQHGQPDLAVRIDDDDHAVFYSGDGLATPETLALASGCDLVVHEAFRMDQPVAGHGTVMQSVGFARGAGAKRLALVHVQRDERRARAGDIQAFAREVHDLDVTLPFPGDSVDM